MTVVKGFFSRRNSVQLLDSNIVVKHFENSQSYDVEIDVYNKYGHLHYMPAIESSSSNTINKQYVGNITLLDELERCEKIMDFDRMHTLLCQAVDIIVHFNCTSNMVLHDVNFANFVVGDNMYFVDVEQVACGQLSQDIAMLLAFLTTYDPANSPYKCKLYQLMCQHVKNISEQLLHEVQAEYPNCLLKLSNRRKNKETNKK